MVEKFGYPYEAGNHGIPFAQIPIDSKTIVKGGSGRDIWCEVSPDNITISDQIDPWFNMMAFVETGTLYLNLNTRKTDGEVHPDFYAAKFVGFALNHFENQGIKINRFRAEWFNDSPNFTQFHEHLSLSENKEGAVRHTWTGRIMEGHGFTKVGRIRITRQKIVVLFFKRYLF